MDSSGKKETSTRPSVTISREERRKQILDFATLCYTKIKKPIAEDCIEAYEQGLNAGVLMADRYKNQEAYKFFLMVVSFMHDLSGDKLSKETIDKMYEYLNKKLTLMRNSGFDDVPDNIEAR